MYLKRLEMVGFKSFAERTRLEFEQGIVAIIGPNGCGKSNVVDAMRWCLGEMSAKSLRSKVLMDVVFNGSANRAPTNMAEVSLTFDNSQNRLPIDFSEVTITRRLFRSGESEYYLNKTQCRLKDIRELFLDTGIGEEGYSIMEQGRVEYILNARPEERRELFEEAAGVSKYKARREEALRKMDRTQLDLDRLADVIAMTKEQMDKIEAAVRKARQYQKAQEDLKSMEISHWLWEITQLNAEIASLKDQIKAVEDDLHITTTQVDQREAELTELRWAETQLGEKLVSLNRELSDIDGSISLSEQKQQNAREREEEIRTRDQVLDRELAHGRARLEELAGIRATAQKELDAEKQAADAVTSALETEETAHARVAAAQKDLENAGQALQESIWKNSQEATRLHNEIAAQRAIETRLDAELKALQRDSVKAEEKVRLAEDAVTGFDAELAQREAELARREAAGREAGDALRKADDDLARLAAQVAEIQERYYKAKAQADAQDALAASDAYAQGAQAVLAAGLPGVQGPLGKLLSVSAGDESAVKQALGAHLNDLVADSLPEAQAALDYLNAQQKGRARFIVLDRLPRVDRAPASVGVGQRAVLDMVRADAKYQPALNFLLGGWIASGGTLYGEGLLEGGAEAAAPGSDPMLRAKLEESIAQLGKLLVSIGSERESLAAARPPLSDAFDEARRAAETARAQRDFFTQEKSKQSQQLDAVRDEIRLIGAESARQQGERAAAEEAVRKLEESLQAVAAEDERLRGEWRSLQQRLQDQQAATSASAAKLAVSRERAQSQQDRFLWRQSQLDAAQGEWTTLSQALESKEQERATSQQRVEEQLNVQEQARRSIETLMAKRRGVEQSLEGIHGERQSLHERLAAAQSAVTGLREKSEELRGSLQDKRLQSSHAELRRETAETQMRDKYQLTAEEAGQRYNPPAQAVPQQDLERLRRRVESLGAVNLAAPEEHAQLEERYNFLLSQQQDLLKAKEDLLQTIQKINQTTRQSFRETFEKVRENFKAIYGQLFKGGEADVRFTDEADVLNSGIEIFAQPPGKKLQNITLLSGGEKALTAVSLLFAFFMVRPAPFCVLDEVDAPLDEANVTRFVTLIKAFTHQSQFLMITHNKRTMELADILYGVTMETLGVSKILSARLKKDTGDTQTPDAVLAAGKTAGEAAAG